MITSRQLSIRIALVSFSLICTQILGCMPAKEIEMTPSVPLNPSEPSECQSDRLPDLNEICEDKLMALATQEECDEGADCETITTLACGEEVSVLCQMVSDPDECNEVGFPSPMSLCEAEGLVFATEEECEAESSCRTLTREGPCGSSYEVLCQEVACTAPSPNAETICHGEGLVVATEQECSGEIECQLFVFQSECGGTSTVRCKDP